MNEKEVTEEIKELIKSFDIAYGRAVAPFTKWLLEELKDPKGRTIRQIVNEGWELFNVSSAIEGVIVSTTMTSATIQILASDPDAIINQKKLKSIIKYEPWTPDDVNLVQRIAKGNTKTRQWITEDIKRNFEWVANYEDNFKTLQSLVNQSGKIDESILRKEVREMTSAIRSSGFSKDFDKELADLEMKIAQFSEMNYTTSDTKKAYQQFMRGVKGKQLDAFEDSVEYAIKKKSKYIARRIARTEQARARIDAYIQMTYADEDLEFYRWNLDASHKVLDECDLYAKADFGLGRGVFPKNKLPRLPSHPHCVCYLTEYYPRDEVNKSDFDFVEGGNSYLKGKSRRIQNQILKSQANGKAFRKGGNWNDQVKIMGEKPITRHPKTRFEEVITSKFL